MSKQTDDWMQKLVENYRIPTDEETKKNAEKKKVLNESQIKKILSKLFMSNINLILVPNDNW